MEDLRTYQIEKEIDPETYFESEEYLNIFKHFGVQVPRFKCKIEQAFTVKTDPEHNYGMEYDLYYVTKTKGEGLIILHKESISSCLNSTPFAICVINPWEGERGVLKIGKHMYSRDQKARDYFAKNYMMVTTC